jgi:hypothetical protein
MDDGKIDYSLSNKVPEGLRAAMAAGKKILVLINPPYAEAANRGNTEVKLGTRKQNGSGHHASRRQHDALRLRIARAVRAVPGTHWHRNAHRDRRNVQHHEVHQRAEL